MVEVAAPDGVPVTGSRRMRPARQLVLPWRSNSRARRMRSSGAKSRLGYRARGTLQGLLCRFGIQPARLHQGVVSLASTGTPLHGGSSPMAPTCVQLCNQFSPTEPVVGEVSYSMLVTAAALCGFAPDSKARYCALPDRTGGKRRKSAGRKIKPAVATPGKPHRSARSQVMPLARNARL
jgi:hypothetical protein